MAVGVWVAVGVGSAVSVAVGEDVGEGVGLGVSVGVGVWEGNKTGASVGVGVGLAVWVGEVVTIATAVAPVLGNGANWARVGSAAEFFKTKAPVPRPTTRPSAATSSTATHLPRNRWPPAAGIGRGCKGRTGRDRARDRAQRMAALA